MLAAAVVAGLSLPLTPEAPPGLAGAGPQAGAASSGPAVELAAPAAAPGPPSAPAVLPAEPAAAVKEAVATRPLAADEAEVCGLRVVRVNDEQPFAQQQIAGGVRTLALQRLVLAMASSGDARTRAASLLLQVQLAIAPRALADAADADKACRQARDGGLEATARFCVDEQARQQAALLEPAAAAIDQLARLAVLSGDPVIYAFASAACAPAGLNFHAREGNCQLVSAEQWARVAPDEAEPWLRLAAQALARDDAAAATQALARAAQACRVGAQVGLLPALAVAAMPAGMPALEQTAAISLLAEQDAGATGPGLDTVRAVCSEPAWPEAAAHEPGPNDAAGPAAGRSVLCDGLARMLAERGRSAAAVGLGAELGERLGWPAERAQAILREQRGALDAVLRFTVAPQALSCDSLRRRREHLLLIGRHGELGAARALWQREAAAPITTDGRTLAHALKP